MRIQIIDLPTQHVGEASESPYLVVMSEIPDRFLQTMQDIECLLVQKEALDHCAGVIMTEEKAYVGEETEEQREWARQDEHRAVLENTAGFVAGIGGPTGPPGTFTIGNLTVRNCRDERSSEVECPEQAEGRGCACSFGAQDCPVNGKTPRAVGVMDIAPEDRAVVVTENAIGTLVAHIAIDVDQTPEELASDVAAIVEEQRENQMTGTCTCRNSFEEYDATCGLPAHRLQAIKDVEHLADSVDA